MALYPLSGEKQIERGKWSIEHSSQVLPFGKIAQKLQQFSIGKS
jgi:hypothetical protein